MPSFDVETDNYGGIIVHESNLPDTCEQFQDLLDQSLQKWTSEGYRLVWLNLPIHKSTYIPIAVELGFSFHHCLDDHIVLTRSLQDSAFVPPYATHFAGAGGLVVSKQNELLVVIDKQDQQKTPGNYKLPGGLIHAGESIPDGIMREVMEETGVRTKFESLAGFGHRANWKFGRPAFYFVCRLTPLTFDITPEEAEIEEAFWMPLDQFQSHPKVHPYAKRIVKKTMNGSALKSETSDHEQDFGNAPEEFF